MTDLLDWREKYPQHPGHKRTDTSLAAANAMAPKAPLLREMVYRNLSHPMTADEMADLLQLDPLSIRPRFTELRIAGKIKDSNIRRKTRFGKKAIVWEKV